MALATVRLRDACAWVAPETTFGTDPGSGLTQIYPVWDSVELTPTQDDLPNEELRSDLYDAQKPVRGNKGGSFSFKCYLRPDTTQLAAATTAATPWLGLLLRFALGAEWPADATANVGTTIATAASGASFTVTSATNVSKGQWLLALVAGALEPFRVANLATTTITPNPTLSATPTTGAGSLVQLFNYAPARSFAVVGGTSQTSFCLRFAQAGHASLQWSLTGCKMDSIEFDLAPNAIPSVTFKGSCKGWSGPSALGYTATAGTNGMGAPFVLKECLFLLQPTTTLTRVPYQIVNAKMAMDLGLQYVEDLSGIGGASGVMRVTGRDFATMTVQAYPNVVASAVELDATWWASQTDLQAVLVAQYGTGAAKRVWIFDIPTGVVVDKPKRVDITGKLGLEATIRSRRSSLVTSPTEGNDLHYCPALIALG